MKEFDKRILANNIKELRRQKNLNQAEMAKQLNVAQQTVAAWETGRTIPGSDTLNILADYFNVSTDRLLGRGTARKKQPVTSDDLDKMLDNARSFDGKPIDDDDREIVRTFLKGRFSNK